MSRRIRRHKVGKLTVRSGFEKSLVEQLKAAKVKFKYEELKLKYDVPARTATYVPDFQLPNGIIVEAKGRLTSADRKKMLLVIQANPDLDIRMVFMKDVPIRKGSSTKCSDWAEKNNIDYAIGEIPEEWLE